MGMVARPINYHTSGTDEVGEDGVELTEEGSPSDFDMIKNSGSIQSLPGILRI